MAGHAQGIRVRLLNLDQVSAVQSQTAYHAIAACAAPHDPPTLCLLRPNRPYISIGYHQQANKEIDLSFCQAHDIPVLRRMIGGGAVLLDEDQLFFHLIIPTQSLTQLRLPLRVADRYPRLAQSAVVAYHRLGLPAEFRPPNDIHVHGRKIGGTGAANIDEAFVFVGSMMLDFDHSLMARVLHFADEEMRKRVRSAMEANVTSIKHETGAKPALATVREALLAGFSETFAWNLRPGALTTQESQHIAALDAEFLNEEWLHHISWHDQRPRKLVINCAVRYFEAERHTTAGLLRLAMQVVDGKIADLFLGGEGARVLNGHADKLRRAFIGASLTDANFSERVTTLWQTETPLASRVTVEDLTALTRKLVATMTS